MASDFGLTTWPLSPSASLSRTGRKSPRRSRRPARTLTGPSAGRPKPAARPASSASAGTEGTSTVRFGSCGLFMVLSPRCGGPCPRIRPPAVFARQFLEDSEKSGKRLKQACCLLLHLGGAARLMEGHDLQDSGPEL